MIRKKDSTSQENRKKRRMLLVSGPAIIALIGAFFYITGQRYVSTDNAYLKANKTAISAEVSGKAAEVKVKDNQLVQAGDLLLAIDPEPYRIAVQQAEATLANTRTDVESMRADYLLKSAELSKAEEKVRYWNKENERFQSLLETSAVSASKAAEVKHEWQSATEERAAAKQELASALARLGGNADIPTDEHPRYREALAALEKAKLNLARTNITAPLTGTASSVTLEPGEYIAAGIPLFSIVDSQLWVEANYKETDLTYVRPGQKATIEVDTFPGKEWKAVVASVTPATGAEFSILPPQNASGNWVKVVQRIMVRLEFEDKESMPPMAAGMSAYVTIDTGHSRLGRWFGKE